MPVSKAAAWLQEEREAEVYLYEDGQGFILGPFCINELQLQLEKCALCRSERRFHLAQALFLTTRCHFPQMPLIHDGVPKHAQFLRTSGIYSRLFLIVSLRCKVEPKRAPLLRRPASTGGDTGRPTTSPLLEPRVVHTQTCSRVVGQTFVVLW